MKVFESTGQIHAEINYLRSQGKKIGLVPTMGALHKGHIALIQQALMACDSVTCSIFVNPLQFNNPDDYKTYPNTITKDTQMLEEIDCHLLFHPDYEQVYGQSKPKEYDLGNLNSIMEGTFRPGHFQGVANVVLRFFEILQPDMAFFGLKDYQQYMVIKRVTEQFLPSIQVVGVETIRDEKGLAMSSRNLRLTPEQYDSAVNVPPLLKEAGVMLSTHSVDEIKTWFTNQVNKMDHLKNEYVEFADADTFDPVINPSNHKNIRVFAAFYAGEVRLIDNIAV